MSIVALHHAFILVAKTAFLHSTGTLVSPSQHRFRRIFLPRNQHVVKLGAMNRAVQYFNCFFFFFNLCSVCYNPDFLKVLYRKPGVWPSEQTAAWKNLPLYQEEILSWTRLLLGEPPADSRLGNKKRRGGEKREEERKTCSYEPIEWGERKLSVDRVSLAWQLLPIAA